MKKKHNNNSLPSMWDWPSQTRIDRVSRLARSQQSPLAPRPWLRECLRSHGTPQNRLLLAVQDSQRAGGRSGGRGGGGGEGAGDSGGSGSSLRHQEWGMAHLLYVGLTEDGVWRSDNMVKMVQQTRWLSAKLHAVSERSSCVFWTCR